MSVQSIGNQPFYPKAVDKEKEAQAAKDAAAGKEAQKESSKKVDSYVKSEEDKPVTYSKNKLSAAQVDQLQAAEQERSQSLMRLIQSMVAKQGEKSNLTLFGQRLNVSPQQSADAAKSIADGGPYSVDAVATRIMDMAKALSGGDPSKIEELRTAVQKGFKLAGQDMGGSLPDISNRTYNEIMDRFDKWENGTDTAE